ncbi:lasso peptide biosynthesis B2 protein [Nonomuraea sp. MG754425]|uniref:lasso peptide biosynthesis B2 protein n=1 Tax=Nonomuraea sp. MG754425 TaxID=2570319 RepID=UPI001F35B3D9|nr:lasso peptide biosynthesis B2 protein [Nonomuraea sp. MG754425]
MSQVPISSAFEPALPERIAGRLAVAVARLLARRPPRRIVAVLRLLRRGARPATYEQALRARQTVTAISTRCAGSYCLPRSLATVLLCRMRGTWPTWHTGVRTPPFAAHAWVVAEGRPVGEEADVATYRPLLTVAPDG